MRRVLLNPLFCVFLTILSDRLGESLVIPLLPYLLERFEPDGVLVGLLTASYPLAVFLATSALGSLSDRYGRRPILLVSVGGTVLSLLLFAGAQSLPQIFAARILDGLTGGTVVVALAAVSDISAPEDRAKNFGRVVGPAFGLGFIIGPALGGLLARWSVTLPVYVAALIAAANFALGWFSLPPDLPRERRQQPLTWRDYNSFRPILQLRRFGRLSGLLQAYALYNLAFGGVTGLFILYLQKQFSWSATQSSFAFVTVGLVAAVVQGGLLQPLLTRWGEVSLTRFGMGCLVVGVALIALAGGSPLWVSVEIYTASAFLALGTGLVVPCLRSLVCNQVSDQEQGQAIGSLQSLQALGSVIGPAIAGVLFDRLGMSSPFWLGALLLLVSLGLLLVWRQPPARSTVVP